MKAIKKALKYSIFVFLIFLAQSCATTQGRHNGAVSVRQVKRPIEFPHIFDEYKADKINLAQPTSLAAANGKIYVSDLGHKRIAIYSGDAEFIGILNMSPAILLLEPECIRVQDGHLFILDAGNSTLYDINLATKKVVSELKIITSEKLGPFAVKNSDVYMAIGSQLVMFKLRPGRSRIQPDIFVKEFGAARINDVYVFNNKIYIALMHFVEVFDMKLQQGKRIYLPELSNLAIIKKLRGYDGTLFMLNAYNNRIYAYQSGNFIKNINLGFDEGSQSLFDFVNLGNKIYAISNSGNEFLFFLPPSERLIRASRRAEEHGEFSRAIELVSSALSLAETADAKSRADVRLGRLYFKAGRYSDALKYIKSAPKTDEINLLLADIYIFQKKYDKASEILKSLSGQGGDISDSAMLKLVKVYDIKGDFDDEADVLKKLAAKSPKKSYYAKIISLYSKLGKYKAIVKFLSAQSKRQIPAADKAFILKKLADAFYEMHEYGAAAKEYKNLLNNYYDYIALKEVYRRLGQSFLQLSKYEDAVDAYKLLLYIETGYKEKINTKYMLAELYFNLMQYKNAEKYYNDIAQNYPDSQYFDKSLWRLAELYSIKNNRDKAIYYFNEYYKYNRHTASGIKALFNIAEIYFQSKKYDKAREYYLKILVASPGSDYEPNIYQRLGNIYELQGDKTAAIDYYSKLISKYPEAKNYNSIASRIKELRRQK